MLAHVDHGKTTLSDHLIASNGLIHPKLAGELRFLDSREEEQARGITMKSSSISLTFSRKEGAEGVSSGGVPDPGARGLPYLINLIDSPGHVDFCSEVSTATRLCDGAIVVVDAVEGVCSQTVAVLRAAWEERVRCVLMVNKIDRLVSELGMTASEAHQRLQAVVGHANMVVSGFASERYMAQADAAYVAEDGAKGDGEDAEAGGDDEKAAASAAVEEEEDADLPAFDPLLGSVVFGSAGDGWAFSLADVARRAAGKLGAKPETLVRFLWGDFAFDPKTKRVVKARAGGAGPSRPTLFASLALEPVWKVYEALSAAQSRASECGPGSAEAKAAAEACVALCRRAAAALGLEVPPRAFRDADPKGAVRALLRAWMPAADAVLEAVCARLPSPQDAAPARAERLLPEGGEEEGEAEEREWGTAAPAVRAIRTCAIAEIGVNGGQGGGGQTSPDAPSPSAPPSADPSSAPPTVVFVSKMVSVPLSEVPATFLDEQRALAGASGASLQATQRRLHLGGGYRPLPSEASDAAADEVFLAFGRVFAGTVRDGQELYVLPHDWDPRGREAELRSAAEGGQGRASGRSDGADGAGADAVGGKPSDSAARSGAFSEVSAESLRPTVARVHGVYLMMGRGMAALPEARAGAVVALGGLGGAVLKSATLASTPRCPALCSLRFQSEPIVRVAVAPENAADYPQLLRGLALLVRADPLARVIETQAGEHLLCVAGEVHLEMALKDLRERFARCGIVASEPLAALRESVAQVGLPVPRAEGAAARGADPGGDARGGGAPGAQGGAPGAQGGAPGAAGATASQSSTWMTAATAPPASQTSVTASSSLPPESLPPPRVAEAATPDGAVRVRARAWALPAAIATLLEKSEEQLAEALERERAHEQHGEKEEETERRGESSPSADASAASAANLPSFSSAAVPSTSLLLSPALRELGAALEKQLSSRGGRRERALRDLLARAWALGPRGRGPNLLLCGRAGAGSLFDAPAELVVRVTRQSVAGMVAEGVGRSQGADEEGAGEGGSAEAGGAGANALADPWSAAGDAHGLGNGLALHPSIVAALRAAGDADEEDGGDGSSAPAAEGIATPALATSVAALTAALASLDVAATRAAEGAGVQGDGSGAQDAAPSSGARGDGSEAQDVGPSAGDAAALASVREALTCGTLTVPVALGAPLAARALGFARGEGAGGGAAGGRAPTGRGEEGSGGEESGEAGAGDATGSVASSPADADGVPPSASTATASPAPSASPSSLLSASALALVGSSALSGFSLASASGPLCAEPLWGVAFELEAAVALGAEDVQRAVLRAVRGRGSRAGAEGGRSLVAAVASSLRSEVSARVESSTALLAPAAALALRGSVLAASPRVVEPHLLAEVSVPAESLSAVYAVLGRRKARIVSEEAREGSGLFAVRAHVPAERAFGFASELRVRASGGASATLALSHWKRVEEDDPFFVPRTEAEREEFGEEGQGVGAASRARRLIDAARERKGLAVSRKVVESATKQRTLARKV